MGNCTTFPLESLIFACVSRAATAYCGGSLELCRTYGDDIIVPQNAALLTLEVLRFLGFQPNCEKTFIHGPFRESCGRDTLWGVDVRPVYLRAVPTDDTAIYGLHNRLLSNRFGFAFDRTLRYLRTLVNRPLWGPAYYGAGLGDLIYLDAVLSDWYAGKSELTDSFFWTPYPPHRGVVVADYGSPIQCWWLAHRACLRRFAPADDQATAYLAFLLGEREGLEETRRWTGLSYSLFMGQWDWPFTSAPPDPKTRPASSRVLRKIRDGVIGTTG